ncbi:MAG: hypothetical protein H6709_05855 [Kofleriaceae bacterium]|nr:hypothetical protein [Myxococcales bacterium]MCB9560472.1 hypothetical protein [Kofleriaceae bacterium]MCB9571597.1 hypothetical protein [Kofleriaceae bacterium]
MTEDGGAPLPPELLEKFRTIGLRLDRAGRFWHQGVEVTHPRLRQALLRWLDVRDDGRDVVRLDDQRYAYVDVDDAHLRAVSARWDDDRVWLRLDDDRDEELAYATLYAAGDGGLCCRVRGGRLRGRLGTAAHAAVAERVVEDRDAPSGFALRAAGKVWPIGVVPAQDA